MTEGSAKVIKVFYSYAPEDKKLHNALEKHLSSLKRLEAITSWHEHEIVAGTERVSEINTHLNTASIVLLLISSNFIASDYHYDGEMKRAMERHAAGEVHVIPIMISPIDCKGTPFDKLQCLPLNGKPVTTWNNRDLAYLDIAQGIRKVIDEIGTKHVEMAALRQEYYSKLFKSSRMLDFKGISHVNLNRPISIPLTDIFVLPDVQVGIPEYETLEREEQDTNQGINEQQKRHKEDLERFRRRDGRYRKEKQSENQREELQNILAKNRRLVILGDPGSGKSTLLRYLMLLLVQEKDTSSETFLKLSNIFSTTPLYIQLASYAESQSFNPPGERSLRDFIPKYLRDNHLDAYTNFLQDQITRGEMLLLLDGLDEIPDKSLRMQIVKHIETFTLAYPKNRFIVTSRIVGYKDAFLAAEYQAYTLADFDEKQIRLFTNQWCPAYERWVNGVQDSLQFQEAAKKESIKLFNATQSRPSVRRLAVNPLLLTILALIQRQGIELPSHRIELYQLCAKTLLDTWIATKILSTRFNDNELIKILRPLAFWMHEHKTFGHIPEEDLIERVARQLLDRKVANNLEHATNLAEDFLRTVKGETGILVERGKHRYGFLHLTFEEYFAARDLVIRRKEIIKFIKNQLHNPIWREVILLAVGTIGIIQSDEDAVTDLIQDAILHAQSPFEEWLHRDLFFAASCLADDVGPSIACEEDIIEQIMLIHFTSKYQYLRDKTKNLIKEWSGTRAENKVVDLTLKILSHLEHNPDFSMPNDDSSPLLGKFFEHYQNLYQIFQESRVKLLNLSIIGILSNLETYDSDQLNYAISLISDPNPDVRVAATTALNQFGNSQYDVIPSLLKTLSDPIPDVQIAAAIALSRLNSYQPAIQSLISALSASDWSIRQAAATALGQLGLSQPDIIQSLLTAFSDPDSDVRTASATALGQLGNSQPNIIQPLLSTLSDSSWLNRQASATALGQLGLSQPDVIQSLLTSLSDPDSDVRTATTIALGQLGSSQSDVIQSLLTSLSSPNWSTRQAAATALGQLGLSQPDIIKALFTTLSDSDLDVKIAAATALGQLSLSQPDIRPSLINILSTSTDTDSGIKIATTIALSRLGNLHPETIQSLIGALSNSNWSIRQAVATALGQLGLSQPDIIKALSTTLSDPDPDVKTAAAAALCQLGLSQPDIIHILLITLSDPDLDTRTEYSNVLIQLGRKQKNVAEYLSSILFSPSIHTLLQEETEAYKQELRNDLVIKVLSLLESIGKSRSDVLQHLLHFLSDPDIRVKMTAITALSQLASSQPNLLQPLLDSLSDPSFSVRRTTVAALGSLANSQPNVIQPLLTSLSDPDPEIRRVTVITLSQLANSQPDILQTLLHSFSDPDLDVRRIAITVLGQLANTQSNIIQPLLASLSDPDPSIRRITITVLGQIDPSRPDIIQPLLDSLSDPDSNVRSAAATTLAQLGYSQPDITQPLLNALSDSIWSTRQAAAAALGQLGLPPSDIIQPLLNALSDPDSDVRFAAATTLGQLGLPPSDIIQPLLNALYDPNISVRESAIITLGQLGNSQPNAIQALLSALSKDHGCVRETAAAVLGQIGNSQPDVIEALFQALLDSNWSVRVSAASSLANLRADRDTLSKEVENLLSLRKSHFIRQFDDISERLLSLLEQIVGETRASE